jgi:predicted nucleic acid-binding protein
MIILDTNVLSALMTPTPDQIVLRWLNRQPAASIWTTTVTLMELRHAIAIMPAGKRRRILSQGLEEVLSQEIEGRIALFDSAAAEQAAELSALRRRKGKAVEFRDTIIAGITLATRAALATRNTTDFEDLAVQVVDPWTA